MSEIKEIKVARYRNTPYVFNYMSNGGIKRYEWAGCKGSKFDIKSLSEEAVNFLLMNSNCFTDGELKIIEDTQEAKELATNIDGLEEYKANTHSKEEIEKLLNGNTNTLKKEISKITNKMELMFFVDVAKEIKLDSLTKQKILADAIGTPVDVLFLSE